MSYKTERKTVVMLGGSSLQLPAIKAAQELGFRVVCADYDPNAPGSKIADGFSLTSTLDLDAVEELARRENASYVITSTSDAPVLVAATVSERLGLPTGISSKNAVCATQKDAMRIRLAEHGVPMPEFYICNTPEEFESALDHFDYSCIAKPVDSAASRGVRLITSEDRKISPQRLFDYFLGYSRKGTVMVEERIHGREVSVEGMTVGGSTSIIAITDKIVTEPPYFVELGHSEPSQLSLDDQEAIRKVAKQTVAAIGIVCGPSHTEIMLTDDGPKVIETAARLGGDYITSKLVPLSTGVDLVRASVCAATGLPVDIEATRNWGSAIRFITSNSGTIKSISVDDAIYLIPGLEEVEIYRKVGDTISSPHSSGDRIGHVICSERSACLSIKSAEASAMMVSTHVG